MSRIDVRHVTHEYAAGDRRITALQDVSFTVGTSESVCVLGQSGCGKPTLLNLLAGFFRPTRGNIPGRRPGDGREGRRSGDRQDFAQLFPWRTAQRNVGARAQLDREPGTCWAPRAAPASAAPRDRRRAGRRATALDARDHGLEILDHGEAERQQRRVRRDDQPAAPVAIDSDQLRRPVHARQESRPMTGEAAEWTST
jgi:energy-coupling factor transporter ATP-binding protein EcfA2